MGQPTHFSRPPVINKQTLKPALEKYTNTDMSAELIEEIENIIDNLIESDKVVVCENCGKLFLESEKALEYEQEDGGFTCECKSPENKEADFADFMHDLDNE